MSGPVAASIRFPVNPRGVAPAKAARRLGLTEARFTELQGHLFSRGFPRPDPDTLQYDLKAIDAWMDRQAGLTVESASGHAGASVLAKLEAWDGRAAGKR